MQKGSLTPYEQSWSTVPRVSKIIVRRKDEYDPHTGMFYAPTSCQVSALSMRSVSMTQEELKQSILTAVRPGYTDAWPTRTPPRFNPRLNKAPAVGLEILRDLLRNIEAKTIFGGMLDHVIDAQHRNSADQILDILASNTLGNRKNRDFVDRRALYDVVSKCHDDRRPIQLILPAFPFKDQNPFRTGDLQPADWDIGEASLMIRLHCLALAINQVHSYDGEVIVLSDGAAYARMFGVSVDQATAYLEGMRELRNFLNLRRTVHFLDLDSLVKASGAAFVLEYEGKSARGISQIKELLEDRIYALARADEEVRTTLDRLTLDIVRNSNLRDEEKADRGLLWRAIQDTPPRPPAERALRQQLWRRGFEAACAYLAYNQALSCVGWYGAMFPGSLRATTHGKVGQVAIPSTGRGAPWNAIGLLDDSALGPSSVRTCAAWDLRSDRHTYLMRPGHDRPWGAVDRNVLKVICE